MADRRRKRSRSQHDCRQPMESPVSSSSRPRAAVVAHVSPKFRTFLVAIALVSCLISINCASHHDKAAGWRPWRESLRRLESPSDRLLLTIDELDQPRLAFASSESRNDRFGGDANEQQFGQIDLAPQPKFEGEFGKFGPLVSTGGQRLAPELSSANEQEDTEKEEQAEAEAEAETEDEQQTADGLAKLMELLRVSIANEPNQMRSVSSRPSAPAPVLDTGDDYESLTPVEPSSKFRYTTDPKDALYFPLSGPEQKQPSEQLELAPFGRGALDKREEQEDSTGLVRDLFQLGREDGKAASSSTKLTTLVEDEQDESAELVGESKHASRADPSAGTNSSSRSPAEKSSTPAPGKSKAGQSDLIDQGLLGRVYGGLLSYLPFLKHLERQSPPSSEQPTSVAPASVGLQANLKATNASGTTTATTTTTTTTTTSTTTTTASPTEAGATSAQSSAERTTEVDIRPVSTKQVVSTLVDSDEAASVRSANDKHEKRQHKKDRTKSADNHDDAGSDPNSSVLQVEDDFDDQRQVFDASGSSISVRGPIEEVKIRHRVPSAQYQPTGGQAGNEHKVSLVRHSSLVMPFRSQDELLAGSSGHPHESLVGRYVYTPESHMGLAGERAPVGQVSQRSSSRGPQDDDIYRPYAAAMHQRLGQHSASTPDDGAFMSYHRNMNTNNNDIYFLVMVASFCGMAMAVVLAAGLFAYRVQQSRKSTCESDYPTYGVVGPNNLNSKCIGGGPYVASYLGSAGCPAGLSPGSGKLAGLKGTLDGHLYGPGASISADSGLATGGKAGSKRVSQGEQASPGSGSACSRSGGLAGYAANQNAARMYHYQHQKQQMISSDRVSTGRHTSASDLDSDDDIDEGNYTVFECSGLASAHDMEIKNPLFNEAQSP